MSQVYEIKSLLNKIYGVLDTVESAVDMPDGLDDMSLRDLFKLEMHSYFMYLSASDGQITPSERDFMNTLMDTSWSVQNYVKFINEQDIYSTDFESRFPATLRLVSIFDMKMQIASALKGEDYSPLSAMLIQFYLDAGKAFIACDGDVSDEEIENLKTYVGGITDTLTEAVRSATHGQDDDDDDDEIGLIGAKKGAPSRPVQRSMSTSVSSRSNQYGPSIYKIGVDMPAGKYKVMPVGGSRAYYGLSIDANGDDIVTNDNFWNQAYVDAHNGQFLELKRCYAVPLDEAPMFDEDVYPSGEYLVGKEIPAGEYRITADPGCRGYFAIETFDGSGEREIDANNNFDNAAYVSCRNGQILVLKNCSISR